MELVVSIKDLQYPRGRNMIIRGVVFIPEPMFYIERRNVISGKLEDVMVDMAEVVNYPALKVFLDYYTDVRKHIEHPEERKVKKARWEYGVVPAFLSKIEDELALVEEDQSESHHEELYCGRYYCNHDDHEHTDADADPGASVDEESHDDPGHCNDEDHEHTDADTGPVKGEDEEVDEQPAAVSPCPLGFLLISNEFRFCPPCQMVDRGFLGSHIMPACR